MPRELKLYLEFEEGTERDRERERAEKAFIYLCVGRIGREKKSPAIRESHVPRRVKISKCNISRAAEKSGEGRGILGRPSSGVFNDDSTVIYEVRY